MIQPAFGAIRRVCWTLGCIFTLGYASKYLVRLRSWELHSASHDWYQLPLEYPIVKQSPKTKQQREWDLLAVVLAVITAGSASSLCIPNFSSFVIPWFSKALFSVAFGLSLEGLILITYLTVFARVSGSEVVWRILPDDNVAGLVAVFIALPAALTTHAALFLLSGLLSLAIGFEDEGDVRSRVLAYELMVLVPVCAGLTAIFLSIVGCEVVVWMGQDLTPIKMQKQEAGGYDEKA